jgi:hypothetical protein
VPDHSTFSVNRHGRFRDSNILRHVFAAVCEPVWMRVWSRAKALQSMPAMEADASRYYDKAPDEVDWSVPQRQTRAVKEYLAPLDVDAQPNHDRKPPKLISKANKRVQFG